MGVVHLVVLDRLLRATTKKGELFEKKSAPQTNVARWGGPDGIEA